MSDLPSLRHEFLRIYKAMRPIARRKVILQHAGFPYTWNPIYIEVRNNTKMADDMLVALKEQGTL